MACISSMSSRLERERDFVGCWPARPVSCLKCPSQIEDTCLICSHLIIPENHQEFLLRYNHSTWKQRDIVKSNPAFHKLPPVVLAVVHELDACEQPPTIATVNTFIQRRLLKSTTQSTRVSPTANTPPKQSLQPNAAHQPHTMKLSQPPHPIPFPSTILI